ncbi:MAG TPA: T9SS type A sorting domain-containing protein [Bacteroidales bacterium]
MKKNYILLFLLTFSVTFAFAQVAGTWKMSPQAAALAVGPAFGDYSWWSNSEADVATRACYFNDEYVFSEDGTFQNVQQEETWDEAWQGVPEGCGAPVAPHDGSNPATWVYDDVAGTITLNGIGSYLGLAKVVNNGELPNVDVPDAITYMVEFNATNDTMTINIEIQGGAYWRFILTTNAGNPPAPSVTFNVNMSYQVTLGNFDPATESVDIAGNFNNWGDPVMECTAGAMDIYTITLDNFTVGEELEYKYRIDGNWDNSEFPGGGPNRTYTVKEGLNVVTVWYNDEVPPPPGILADFENDTWGVLTPHVMGCGEYDNDALHPVDETFMIIDNPDKSGINTSNKVLKFIRRGTDNGGVPWGGFWAQCTPAVNTTETKYVHYMVWKPMISPVKFKLEGATQLEASSTGPQTEVNAWQDMVFNFSELADADYGVVALMPDFQDPFETAEDVDMYIDNIVINSDPNPISGIWNNNAESTISMYPNPFTTSINIDLKSDMNSITISNIVGQQLYIIENVNRGPINIDASSLDSGVYIITLTDKNNKTTSAKLMKN